jgi:hypothetical protein
MKYEITWLDDEDNLIDTTEVEYGKIPEHEDPVKEPTDAAVYTFSGWDPTPVEVEEEATYKATFTVTPKVYMVTWKDDNGSVLEVDEGVPYGTMPSYDGKIPSKPATPEFTYEFTGWTPEVAKVTKDVVYTATYNSTVNGYTITWLMDDGETVLERQILGYGMMPEYTGNMPTKPNTDGYSYTFAGWTPEMVPVSGNADYTATFAATPIPVTPTAPPLTPAERSFSMNRKFKVYFGETPDKKQPEAAMIVEWGHASGIASYEVFAYYLDEEAPTEPTHTFSSGAYRAYFTELNGEKIDFSRGFVVCVVAKNWKGVEVGRTVNAYVAGPENADYTNPAAVNVTSEKTVTLKVGQSSNITAMVTLEDATKQSIPDEYVPELRYVSNRENIATVSEDGEIVAVHRGSCIIQVFAKNALVDEIKVNVR